jgi:hypothetical protein
MNNARAAEARVRTLTKLYCIVPERVWAVEVWWIQAVALHESALCWDPREVGRSDDLQCLLNTEARSTLGVLPTTLLGALMSESGLPMAPVIFNS